MEWLRKYPDTLSYHLAHQDPDTDTYTFSKRLVLGAQLMAMKRIYLDTKHWVHLRDVEMGRPRTAEHKALFDRLDLLLHQGNTICPISYSVFVELMRQSDLTTRLATARVVGRFSKHCCILPPDHVMEREVMCFLRHAITPWKNVHPVHHIVWTKNAFILGETSLNVAAPIPKLAANAMTKSMDDLLWSLTTEDLINQLGHRSEWKDDLSRCAERLTYGKMAGGSSTPFGEVFLQEVHGGLSLYDLAFGKLLLHISHEFGFDGKVPRKDLKRAGKNVANLIYSYFKAGRDGTILPSVHIQSGLHAALRCDPNRRYKEGDVEDFRHATAAIGYFDAFCTDKSLCHLIRTKPLEYDKVYGRRVVSEDREMLEMLDNLVGG